MAVKFQKARFVYSPFSQEQMLNIGNALAESVKARIHAGLNDQDQSAKPLHISPHSELPYPQWKAAHGLQSLRDWFRSGRTLKALKVLRVSENGGRIGFADPKADKVADINNKMDRTFGESPLDHQAVMKAFADELMKSAPSWLTIQG